MGTHFQIHGDTFPNTWGHISKYMGTHFQIHGDTFPNTYGHISKYMGTHFQIHGDTFPNTWGHISKYMGTHFQIHGDAFPNTRGYISKYMGTHFQIHGDTLPNKWGHVANTKYMYNSYGDRLLLQMNIYGISSIAMHTMRAGVHSTLGSSPGNLVFNRDMFLNIPLIADWHAITQRQVHDNGTVTIQLKPGLTERINIR
jgi:hypothetical protein